MMLVIAMSRTTFMLLFHITALVFLLPICGFFVMTVALMVGLPVVEGWQALMAAIRNLPKKLWASAIACCIRLGLIDPVKLELRRIERVSRVVLRDIDRLHQQALRAIERLAGEN